MTLKPIGTIHTPFKDLQQMPIQPKGAADTQGTLVLHEAYKAGLKDLEGFSHVYILYYFHKATRTELLVTPFMDTEIRGVFSTRSPLRPSHLGMSVCEVISVLDTIITLKGIDVLDGTPLLDIKPYIPQFDRVSDIKTGWMTKNESEVADMVSDNRFV